MAPFLEEQAARVRQRQRRVPLAPEARCDQSKLILQLEVFVNRFYVREFNLYFQEIRGLIQNTEIKVSNQLRLPEAVGFT